MLWFTAALACAQVNVTIEEFEVPTQFSHPHDPAVGPEDALWYTGQQSDKFGRLDTKTASSEEFALDVPDSGPHGLVAERMGTSGSPATRPVTSAGSIRPPVR
jgi:virginiamycin B lyase